MTRTHAKRGPKRHRPNRLNHSKQHRPDPPLKRHAYRAFEADLDRQIGRRMRVAREARGVTLVDLAGVLGISYQQLQKYERAIDRVAASRLRMIADELDVTMDYFVAEVPPPQPVAGPRTQRTLPELMRAMPTEWALAYALIGQLLGQASPVKPHDEEAQQPYTAPTDED